jgi:deoxyribonuclease-4
MPILGSHMSIAGGYYKAVEAAKKAGCDCVQVFTKNPTNRTAVPSVVPLSYCQTNRTHGNPR